MRAQLLLLVLAAALAAPAQAACPRAPKSIGRPAMLGSVFPTPRVFTYTGAKRGKNGAAVVTGYSTFDTTLPTVHNLVENAMVSWFNTIAGSGRYHADQKFGNTHSIVPFKAWSGTDHGQVDIYKTCSSKRVIAVITLYEE